MARPISPFEIPAPSEVPVPVFSTDIQLVTSHEDIMAAALTLQEAEWRAIVQEALCHGNPIVISFLRCQLAHVLLGRDAAAAKVLVASESIKLLVEGLSAVSITFPELDAAPEKLHSVTDPIARGAAEVERVIHNILMRVQDDAEIKELAQTARRDTLEVVVDRCRACCRDPEDRRMFDDTAYAAYEGDMDMTCRSRLHANYHKGLDSKEIGFASASSVLRDRRGKPRVRKKAKEDEQPEAASSWAAEDAEVINMDIWTDIWDRMPQMSTPNYEIPAASAWRAEGSVTNMPASSSHAPYANADHGDLRNKVWRDAQQNAYSYSRYLTDMAIYYNSR